LLPDLKFDDKGLIPVVVQEIDTKEVLMVAYMDEVALKKQLKRAILISGPVQGKLTGKKEKHQEMFRK